MEKTLAEYKKELENQITSFKNIHYALKSGSWNLQFDAQWNRFPKYIRGLGKPVASG